MANRVTRADIMEIPLPSSGVGDGICMPMVIMQPTADASDYMLKPNYATNGRPGVVDHAVLADEASTVVWSNITSLPSQFPPLPHATSHMPGGTDRIPIATAGVAGLCPQGDGQPNDYLGGDIVFHTLPGLLSFRNEADVTLEASFSSGAQLAAGVIPNPAVGVYEIEMAYLYNANQTNPPKGMVHFDMYDPSLPGWVALTASTDISVMTPVTYLLKPTLLSAAMTRVFSAGANALNWRLVLDTAGGVTCYFRAGIGVRLFGYSSTIP